jgi:hypothetical protein
MHAQAPPPSERNWHQNLVKSGYFIAAILLHLIVFLLLATIVIWKAPTPSSSDVFRAVSTQPAIPPPPQPPSSGAAADNPQMEPQQVTVPVVTPPSMITTSVSSSFHLDASKIVDQALSHINLSTPQGSGLGSGESDSGTGPAIGFGSVTGSGNQFIGYFYDLKQTTDRKPTGMTMEKWRRFTSQYVNHGWDDAQLATYFRSKTPLYTSIYAISTRLSEEAPKAFGLASEVRPAMWLIRYHAKVSPPSAGDYRFVGFGDDVLEVRVNQALVLDAGWISMSSRADVHQPLPTVWSTQYSKIFDNKERLPGMGPTNGFLKRGSTFHVEAAESVDIDVLMGDQGGFCSYYLLIEKVGDPYDKLPDGTPLLPFFQISTSASPTFSNKEEHPPYSSKAEPWQAVAD